MTIENEQCIIKVAAGQQEPLASGTTWWWHIQIPGLCKDSKIKTALLKRGRLVSVSTTWALIMKEAIFVETTKQ
jgi:hypothetical protein